MSSLTLVRATDVVGAGVPPQELGVALDPVQEGGGEGTADLDPRRAQVLGHDGGRCAVAGADVAHDRVVARSLGMVVDDHVHREDPRRGALAEDGGLHVHEGDAVELVELLGGEGPHLEPQRLHHGEILGPRDLAEGAQRGGRALAAQQGPQGHPRRDAVGVGVGLQQDGDALPPCEKLAHGHHAAQVGEVLELGVHVVADQGAQPGPPQTGMVGQIVVRQPIGEEQDRRLGGGLFHRSHCRADEGPVLGHDGELVVRPRLELLDCLGGEPAGQGAEPRRSGAGLFLARNPGELFLLAGADPAPESS
jgi:hypothetical protein